MDDPKEFHIDDIVRRAMDDLGLEGDVEHLPEKDQYRVISKMLDYNLEVLTKLNEDMQTFVARMDNDLAAHDRIMKAKEERRYVTTYEDRIQ